MPTAHDVSSLHFVCETYASLPERALQLLQALRFSLDEKLAEEEQTPPTTALCELSAIRCLTTHHAPHLEILGVVYSGSRPLLSVHDTASLSIVTAFGSLADLIAYLHCIPGTREEELHEI